MMFRDSLIFGLALVVGTLPDIRAERQCDDSDCEEVRAPPARKYKCVDKHDTCGHWASIGECDANPGYMHLNCAVSCDSCGKLDPARCVRSLTVCSVSCAQRISSPVGGWLSEAQANLSFTIIRIALN